MADPDFTVTAAAGSMRSGSGSVLPHAWTEEGVEYAGPFTGAHLLHLSVACCVLNDAYREGRALGLAPIGVSVTTTGGFSSDWLSTGITWALQVDGLTVEDAETLTTRVEQVAEIPRVLRAATTVERTP